MGAIAVNSWISANYGYIDNIILAHAQSGLPQSPLDAMEPEDINVVTSRVAARSYGMDIDPA